LSQNQTLNWETLIVMDSTFAMTLVRCIQNVLRSKTNTWRKPKGQSRMDNQETPGTQDTGWSLI